MSDAAVTAEIEKAIIRILKRRKISQARSLRIVGGVVSALNAILLRAALE